MVTRAWTSTKKGRVPSMMQVTMEPGAFFEEVERNFSDGFLTCLRPCPVISKMPTSLVEPKRFLTLRKILKS